jgi:hypothetical protein
MQLSLDTVIISVAKGAIILCVGFSSRIQHSTTNVIGPETRHNLPLTCRAAPGWEEEWRKLIYEASIKSRMYGYLILTYTTYFGSKAPQSRINNEYVKVKDSRNRPSVAQRFPGGLGSKIFMTFGTWRW